MTNLGEVLSSIGGILSLPRAHRVPKERQEQRQKTHVGQRYKGLLEEKFEFKIPTATLTRSGVFYSPRAAPMKVQSVRRLIGHGTNMCATSNDAEEGQNGRNERPAPSPSVLNYKALGRTTTLPMAVWKTHRKPSTRRDIPEELSSPNTKLIGSITPSVPRKEGGD